MCEVRLGGDESEYLLLLVRGRSRPGAADYWDGNWLDGTAEVAAGAFRGRLVGSPAGRRTRPVRAGPGGAVRAADLLPELS